ncbi:MAG: hypothetical protein IT347_02900 [Candidatus Eisenbacteria bacterium]|nr:hypothetical protein [Candidatus Eisenbacteria bacterium]
MSPVPATATGREPRVLVDDLPAEHLDELEWLWSRRQATVRSFEHFAQNLADLDGRMAANAAGLEAVPSLAWPLLEEALGAKESSRVAAAAWTLLRMGGEAEAMAVPGPLESGPPPAREGARQALVRGPLGAALPGLKALAAHPDAAIAVAAAEALAAHGTAPAPLALAGWLSSADADVRLAACRVAAWAEVAADKLEPLARGDAEEAVRFAAYEAGVWMRAPWALALGRERAKAKDESNTRQLALFCALAGKADAPLVAALGAHAPLGPVRFAMLAACGNFASMEACLAGMAAKDAKDAEAAGAAFLRLTGFGAGPAKRVALPPPADAGPDAAEFADEAFVPDPAHAQRQWEERKEEFAKGGRWARGLDADGAGVAAELDLGSRFETMMRARFKGGGSGGRRELLQV